MPAAGFAKAGERAENRACPVFLQGCLPEGELRVIECALFIGQLNRDDFLRLGRQFGGDQLLVAADDQRRKSAAQGGKAAVLLDVAILEVLQAAKEAWIEAVHDRPKILRGILQRRARQGDGVFCGKGVDGGRHLRGRILDGLRLVQNQEVKFLILKEFHILTDDLVVHYDDVRLEIRQLAFPLGGGSGNGGDGQRRAESLRLRQPDRHDGGRADDQCLERLPTPSCVVSAGLQNGENLKRFAETHVVRQNGSRAACGAVEQKLRAFLLIAAEKIVKMFGKRR